MESWQFPGTRATATIGDCMGCVKSALHLNEWDCVALLLCIACSVNRALGLYAFCSSLQAASNESLEKMPATLVEAPGEEVNPKVSIYFILE